MDVRYEDSCALCHLEWRVSWVPSTLGDRWVVVATRGVSGSWETLIKRKTRTKVGAVLLSRRWMRVIRRWSRKAHT